MGQKFEIRKLEVLDKESRIRVQGSEVVSQKLKVRD